MPALLGALEAKLADFGLALYVGGNFFSEPPSAQFGSAESCSGKYVANAMRSRNCPPSAASPKANYSMPIAGTPRPGELFA